MTSTMRLNAKTYGGPMTLILAGEIDEAGNVTPSDGVVSIIKFKMGITTIYEIYVTRFCLEEPNHGDYITYNIEGKDYTFNWAQGMELWGITDQLWWEYALKAYPEFAAQVELKK